MHCKLVCCLVAVTTASLWADDALGQLLPGTGIRNSSNILIDDQCFLEFFRRLTLTNADQERIRALIVLLDSDKFKEREKAHNALLTEGPRALALMYQAIPNATLEKRLRLERCIKTVERFDWDDMVTSLAHLVKEHKPAGSVETLLDFAPFASPGAIDAVFDALCGVGVQRGRFDQQILAALDNPVAAKRAAAAVVVGSCGNAQERKAVLPLLEDNNAVVRLRAAQTLLAWQNTSAVPVLIALLAQNDEEVAERAELVLHNLGGESIPKVSLGATKLEQEKCHAAWLAWWSEQKERLDFSSANVGLSLVNTRQAAKRAAAEFWTAIARKESIRLERGTLDPFFRHAEFRLVTVRTSEAFAIAFADVLKEINELGDKFSFSAGRVRTLTEELKLMDNKGNDINGLPRANTQVVEVELRLGLKTVVCYMIIRIAGSRPSVIGIAQLPEGIGK